uniref:Mce/MlaD domain-containing protein n=1 Tax=Liagoropsis maxima TaxID=1653392 RepID=A0A1G4NVS9_9FLOR|nr:Hypothetical protein ycf22 [Liagoropsis maxima]SCW22735.1 Hypothetical protein ycf22 [Liagoropsis maxima]
MKIISSNVRFEFFKIIFLVSIVFFSFVSWIIINNPYITQGYSIFIEFENANGVRPGTLIRLRGLSIGSVVDIASQTNSVLAIANIYSSSQLIPKNSLIETNQMGLLNDSVIDIIPLEIIKESQLNSFNPLSKTCLDYPILCHLSYIQGDRGLNYDDLVRATTRISQRFDDPRFFHLFYIFLQNSIELTDRFVDILTSLADMTYLFPQRLSIK